MRFDIDALIVFAEGDDQSDSRNELGWVSQFKKFLDLMLTQILGEKPNILLKAEYDNMTSPKLENVGVLITILSESFIKSRKCLDHVDAFQKAINPSDPIAPRLFKVFRTPLIKGEQPQGLRELIGYDMFQVDSDTGEFIEYSDYFSAEAERQYWMKMVDLTYDIYESLKLLKGQKANSTVNYKRKTIFLAETGHDLSVQRNIIKRELQRHGYTVLPNQSLPGTVSELERAVRRDLERSNLSIHLIGSAYGEVPEGSSKSVVDLQNKLSAERSIQAKHTLQDFSRLIWIPSNLTNASERQKAFIESIKRDVEAQEGVEILQTSLEDFKNIMREELLEAVEKKVVDDSSGKSIYVMHDRIDQTEVKPFIEMIKDAGFEVLIPEFDGELLDLRQKHIENLRKLDAAIIYKGKVNEHWVRMKALDLLKAPGFGRKKPIVGKAIVTHSASVANNEVFRAQNLRVIEGDEKRSLESLKTFLNEFTD